MLLTTLLGSGLLDGGFAGSAVPPVALFSGTPRSGSAPLEVTFTDESNNAPTSWAWNFGDGNTSTSQNPVHTYTLAGTYTVTLVATNADGSDDEVKTGYVVVGDQVVTPDPVTPSGGGSGRRRRLLAVLFGWRRR